MNFHVTFCDPFKRDIVDLGNFSEGEIISKFEQTPWEKYLSDMQGKNRSEIFYSPSFEVADQANRRSLSVSAVGSPEQYEFYIFYKRPKMVRGFLSFSEKMKEGYVSDKTGQTKEDGIACLNALMQSNIKFLEEKF